MTRNYGELAKAMAVASGNEVHICNCLVGNLRNGKWKTISTLIPCLSATIIALHLGKKSI
jgi:hypothetical protein